MFERFTDRARQVMVLANQAAQRFNHEYIGTGAHPAGAGEGRIRCRGQCPEEPERGFV